MESSHYTKHPEGQQTQYPHSQSFEYGTDPALGEALLNPDYINDFFKQKGYSIASPAPIKNEMGDTVFITAGVQPFIHSYLATGVETDATIANEQVKLLFTSATCTVWSVSIKQRSWLQV